tara:strand:- start:36 stop:380 length:345 start_codon:yes stop_codon:yes gene_type:complete
MKIRIVENSRIPAMLSWFINIGAITLYPFIISRGVMSKETLNHERIHIEQQKELLVVGFYLLYIMYWLVNLLWHKMGKSEAYLMIPFEKEAYANDGNPDYLKTRRRFAWLKKYA